MIQTALLRIAYGELPKRLPEMTLRSVSQDSSTCVLCRRAIEPDAAEVQFPDAKSGGVYVLHPECYAAWATAVRRLSAEAASERTRVPARPTAVR